MKSSNMQRYQFSQASQGHPCLAMRSDERGCTKVSVLTWEKTPYQWIRPPPEHLPHQADEYSKMSWEAQWFLQVMLISPCPCDCSGIGTEGWSRFCLVWKCPWWFLLSQFHLACSERWKFFWNFDTDCGKSPKWEMMAILTFKTVFFVN